MVVNTGGINNCAGWNKHTGLTLYQKLVIVQARMMVVENLDKNKDQLQYAI